MDLKSVQTCFKLSFTEDQYQKAVEYVEDMKRHKDRVYWVGKEGKSDEELILSHIAHRILSGFYNNYDPLFARRQIMDMTNSTSVN